MKTLLYDEYKQSCCEFMKTARYTERILYDNNSDQTKLIRIYEKALESAEQMFKKMQLEIETNPMLRSEYDEFNEIKSDIAECKRKLRNLKEEIMKKEHRNIESNSDNTDHVYLLNDVDLLEKGDVYINQSKVLMDNTEYIGNDVMRNLNTQKENIKKNITNISFVSNNLDNAKQIMKKLKYKDVLNKYRLYIIYIFIILTFLLIVVVKYRKHVRQNEVPQFYSNNSKYNVDDILYTTNEHELDTHKNISVNDLDSVNVEQAQSIVYDFIDAKEIHGKQENERTGDTIEENKNGENKYKKSENGENEHGENYQTNVNVPDMVADHSLETVDKNKQKNKLDNTNKTKL